MIASLWLKLRRLRRRPAAVPLSPRKRLYPDLYCDCGPCRDAYFQKLAEKAAKEFEAARGPAAPAVYCRKYLLKGWAP